MRSSRISTLCFLALLLVFLLCTCTSTPLRALGINASSGGRAHANATLSNPPTNGDHGRAYRLS